MKAKQEKPCFDRQIELTQRRRMKMAQSAHAYVRGNTIKFYEWLESARAAELIPHGPPVWICGDCHIGNLGPVAGADGTVEIQIRDLDQTVIGNPAHDLIRLCLSLTMAARSSDLPGITTALMMEQVAAGYRAGLNAKKIDKHQTEGIAPIASVMRQALKRRWRHLAEERIEDVEPRIPLGKRFWELSKIEESEIRRIFTEDATRKLITSLNSRRDDDEVSVLDAAYWVKGCSSLGRVRYAALIGIGKHGKEGMCLVDIKESTKSAAPRAKDADMPSSNSERVVTGARALSPLLGSRMLATRFANHGVVLRELMPQDLKFELDRLSGPDALAIARVLAQVVGRAHGRQMDRVTRSQWLKEWGHQRSKTLDAPSWLWDSTVELAMSHEGAYLEHCRVYAGDVERAERR